MAAVVDIVSGCDLSIHTHGENRILYKPLPEELAWAVDKPQVVTGFEKSHL